MAQSFCTPCRHWTQWGWVQGLSQHAGNSWPDLEASWLAEASDRPDADLASQHTDPDALHDNGSKAGPAAVSVGEISGGTPAAADDDGPILSQPDVGTPEERLTSMVEQCLAWGGEQRLRLQVTLSTSGAALGPHLACVRWRLWCSAHPSLPMPQREENTETYCIP